MKKKRNFPRIGDELITSGGILVMVVKVPSLHTGMYYNLKIVENRTALKLSFGTTYAVDINGKFSSYEPKPYDIAHHIPKPDMNKMSRRY
jgi:hypothetical protein